METVEFRRVVNGGGKRRYRSALGRRQIVEETLQPGASVAIIARAREVNANQVFCWRKLYRQGQLDSKQDSAELAPVRVSDSAPRENRKPVKKEASSARLKRGVFRDLSNTASP